MEETHEVVTFLKYYFLTFAMIALDVNSLKSDINELIYNISQPIKLIPCPMLENHTLSLPSTLDPTEN